MCHVFFPDTAIVPYVVTLAVLEFDSVTIVPVFTTLTIVTEGMLQTLLAETTKSIARVGITDIDIAVTLARFTEVTWKKVLRFLYAVKMLFLLSLPKKLFK
jgi:hypothetical protein